MHVLYTGCPKNHRQRLTCRAGRQAHNFSRQNPYPEPHGLRAIEDQSFHSTCRQETEHVQQIEQSTLHTGFKLCTSYVIAEPTPAVLSFTHMTQ